MTQLQLFPMMHTTVDVESLTTPMVEDINAESIGNGYHRWLSDEFLDVLAETRSHAVLHKLVVDNDGENILRLVILCSTLDGPKLCVLDAQMGQYEQLVLTSTVDVCGAEP